jgi:hypothetical protein
MLFHRPRSALSFAAITVGMLIVLAIAGCRGKKPIPTENVEEDSDSNPIPASTQTLPGAHSIEVRFPRRLLFIQISQYTSLNPLGSIEPGKPDQARVAALQLAQGLKIPTQKDSQLYLVSDAVPQPENNLPSREVVVGAYERFFETSKATDRIIVYFGGHAIEVAGKAYLAPLEGNKYDAKTLIPLQDFYSKLKACHAVQKVVVWDVCRFNPDRGRPLPGGELMSASLLKALINAPEGVEVVVTCMAGEHALEFTNLQIEPRGPLYSGSAFLEANKFVVEKNRMVGVVQVPNDPIPVAEWVSAIGKRVADVTASHDVGLKQTVRYYGRKAGKVDAAPEPIDPPSLSKGSLAEILSIVDEFRIPPIKNGRPAIALAEYPYREEVIAAYKSDVSIAEIQKNKQKYEFRNVTLNAYQTIRDVWTAKPKGGGLQQRDSIGAITNNLKSAIKKELEPWAIGITKLEQVNLALENVATQKKGQPRRWQAHYDYARAIVKFRLAYMNEYDKLMGDVLTETLPPLDKGLNQTGYKLASSEKMKSKKDIQKLAEEALEAFDVVITEYKDTPWAIQAKYEKSSPLGLIWQPSK